MERHCPACGSVLPSQDAPSQCPSCGAPWRPPASPTIPFDCPTWKGLVSALWRTWSASLFTPASFFQRVASARVIGWPLLYVGLFSVALLAINAVQQPLADRLFAALPYRFRVWGEMLHTTREANVLFALLAVPHAFAMAALFHALLHLLAEARPSFVVTLRTVCYTYGVVIVWSAPILGWVALPVLWVVLLVIGLASAHRVEAWRCALAVLLPTVVCCGGMVFLGILAAAHLLRALPAP